MECGGRFNSWCCGTNVVLVVICGTCVVTGNDIVAECCGKIVVGISDVVVTDGFDTVITFDKEC